MSSTVVGGEFDIDINLLSGIQDTSFLNEGYLYSSGRAALYHILLYIKSEMRDVRWLMLPDYLCHSIIDTVQKTGFEIIFYPLSASLSLKEDEFRLLYKEKSAVLIINYFGLVPLNKQVSFLRQIDTEMCIIEDNVQSFFSMAIDNGSDFQFTSFRKTLPLPDGGWVKTHYTMSSPSLENTFAQYKIAGGILKSFRTHNCFDDQIYLKLLEIGEEQIDVNLNNKVSNLTLELLSGIDLNRVSILRKRNARYLVTGLKSLCIEPLIPLSENCIPLFVPIYLENRDKLRRLFFKHNIYCPVHWPIQSKSVQLLKGEELAKYELSLVIDQRYGLEDMNRILTVIQDSLHGNSYIK